MLAAPLVLALAQITFTEVTDSAGVSHTHALEPILAANIMIAGGAVGDFDRDGWPDLFVLGGGGTPDRLFLNQGDGTFVDQAAAWGIDEPHHGVGASAADYDGDGWLDLFVTSFGPATAGVFPGQHRLYHNDGGTGFTDVAAAAGVQTSSPYAADGYSSTFGDYDLDGDLDLFVTGWELVAEGNRLYQNQGDGTFVDVTVAAGVFDVNVKGFVPTFADMDGDRWPELLLIADSGTSKYFANDGDGTFSKPGNPPSMGSLNGMGCAVGDYDEDGLLDFYGTSIAWSTGGGNMLWMSEGAHVYDEDARDRGVQDGAWGWGTLQMDFDHDGLLDLVETNGWNSAEFSDERTRIFHNQGDAYFQDLAVSAGMTHDGQGRGLARLDYDRDGDFDLAIFSNQEEFQLWRNDTVGGNWLQLELDTAAHPGLAPDGIGTKVWFEIGDHVSLRYLDGGASYLATSEQLLEMGLGAAAQVDHLVVEWADGSRTELRDVAANQRLRLDSGLPFEAPETIAAGETGDLLLHGAQPGERVAFLVGFGGPGAGHCPDELGFLCLDIAPPYGLLGQAYADAQGTAAMSVFLRPNLPNQAVGVQAAIPRGLAGADSVKSNARLVQIRP